MLWSDRKTTYDMNICSVKTEVWQSSRTKFDACNRQSDEYFLDVNPIMTGMPLSVCQQPSTSLYLCYTPNQAEALEEADVGLHKLKRG